MIYARNESGERIRATPNSRAKCPYCKQEVIAKCGRIKVWHWAHKSTEACDTWGEPETDWHLFWKDLVPPQRAEVTIERASERHRADILMHSGTVVELQHSSIPPEEIHEREAFYDSMVWLFDIRDCCEPWNGGQPRFNWEIKDDHTTFRWKHPRKHIAKTTSPTFLDLRGGYIMRLEEMHTDAPCAGWGRIGFQKDFEEWLSEGTAT